MAFTPPEKLPETMDELDALLSRVHEEGKEAGKRLGKQELREAILDHLMTKFFGSKNNQRRADPENPKTAAILKFWEELSARFKDGSL